MFDLQSLATLAAARALEMGSQEGGGAASGRCFPARRILNLRRKFNWTPRNEPVNTHLHPPGRLGWLNVKVLIVKPVLVRLRRVRPRVPWKRWTGPSSPCA